MKIVYDNSVFSIQRAGGASMYWYELIKRFKKEDNIMYYDLKNDNIFRKNLDICSEIETTFPIRIVRHLPFLKKITDKSILHSCIYRVSLDKNIINIVTVHDFTYEYFMGWLPKKIHTLQKYFAIRHADGIICVSENTKKDLIKFLPDVDQSKIKVIYHGVSDEFFRLENPVFNLIENFPKLENINYIIFVGDRSKYKNFNIVIEVMKQLKDFKLVVIGGKNFTKEEELILSEINERIIHLKGLDSNKLNVLYNNAFCMLYPSSYEGFGIPVLEAMKSGCPVVSTKMSSIPEVAGEAGLLVNEINVENFILEIVKLKDVSFRNEIIEKGLNQSGKFSWDKCFSDTFEFYNKIWKKYE